MIAMRDDAVKVFFLGVEVYGFGLYVALGMALGLVVLALLTRREKWRDGTAALTGVLSICLGVLVSRLFFGLMDECLGRPLPLWAMLRFNSGGYSMIGALLGACMGGILSAGIMKKSPARMLDLLAPALLLFIACERLGEGYIEDFGVSRTLTDTLLEGSFLAVKSGYGWRLATYQLESFTALALSLVLLRDVGKNQRAGNSFILFLLLYGGTQVLLESLRYDQHMTVKAFVKLQQIMDMMLLGAGVITAAARAWNTKRGLAIVALIVLALSVGIGVAIEFMLDRTQISHYVLYLCFLIDIALPVWLGIKLRKEE